MKPPVDLPRQRWLAVPPVILLVLAAGSASTGFDLWVVSHFFEPTRGLFPGRWSFWASDVAHDLGRILVVCVGIAALGALALGSVERRGPRALAKANLRRVAGYVVLTLVLGSGLVTILKETTNVDCPWDLEIFGGDRPHVLPWALKPAEVPRGKCFPGGHSSGAFGLFSLYFVARERSRPAADTVLGSVLLVGLFFSATQWVRGAHFPSHDLVSAALCWTTAVILYRLPFHGRLFRLESPREEHR